MGDEELYLKASSEVEGDSKDPALWAKAMALADGDQDKAKYQYIKLRVEQLAKSKPDVQKEYGVHEAQAEAAGKLQTLRKKAEAGDVVAQYRLGVMYHKGKGVPKDDVTGYAWYNVAAASRYDKALTNRDRVRRKLTPSQLEKGQVMAREIYERGPIYERIAKQIEKRKAAEAE